MFLESFDKLVDIFIGEEKSIDYLFEKHIIVKPEVCEHCSHGIQYYSNKKIFQCKNYKCRKINQYLKILYFMI
jgi:hypothetical protein